MLFDLIACNGAKRTYYVLNGECISPYDFSVTTNASGQNRKFQLNHESNSITLTTDEANRTGSYYTDIPIPNIDLDDCMNLCFVMSAERFTSVTLSINILRKGSEYPDSNLKRVMNISSNGKRTVYKINLENLLADEFSIYSITLTANSPAIYENLPNVKIYQMYSE